MNRLSCVLLVVFLILGACDSDDENLFVDLNKDAPEVVSVLEVVNIPGGAIINYEIPDDENLLGVKASYTRNNELVEVKASKYVDTIRVEGFGDTASQEIELRSIGYNGKESSPILVDIDPLLPPVKTVRFELESGFGGVVVDLKENTTNSALAVIVLADTIGDSPLEEIHTFYTQATEIKLARRGLKPVNTNFGVFIRDRWGNVSDTLYASLTPIQEIELPKSDFRNAALPTDYFETAEGSSNYRLENLWSGDNSSFYASSHSGPIPQWFTIDLGRKMSISRIQKWPRDEYELYSSTAPRTFEVWGSDDPNPDGSWDESWELLGEFEQFKPSGYGEGLAVGPITDEDIDYWYNRTEFEFIPTENAPNPHKPVTHLRFKITSTFKTYGTEDKMSQVIIGELTFWGQLVD